MNLKFDESKIKLIKKLELELRMYKKRKNHNYMRHKYNLIFIYTTEIVLCDDNFLKGLKF